MIGCNLRGVNLSGLDLSGGILWKSDLSDANLSKSICLDVEFAECKLVNTNLQGADLDRTEFGAADLTNTNLQGANLENSSLLGATVEGANFDKCIVYGLSAWDLTGTPKSQKDLIVTPRNQGDVTTDDLEFAQFVYLIYNNKKIRNFMNTLTEKNVLILGRFSPPERKIVLDGLREKLRTFNLLPIVFDFDAPTDRDLTETVQTLAGMSMFVIVDVTNPKSTPLEMEATVKQFKIPFVPIIDTSADQRPFAMMVDLQKSFHWVLPTFAYKSKEELFKNLKIIVVDRALEKHNQLRDQKAKEGIAMLTIDDLLKTKKKKPAKKSQK